MMKLVQARAPYRTRCSGLIFLAVVVCLLLSPAVQAAWEITQFEVFAGAPYQRAGGAVEAIGFDWAEMEDFNPGFDRAEIEDAFHEAARWFSNRDFPEPLLEPILEMEYGPAYRIYVCSEELKASRAFHNLAESAKRMVGLEGDIPQWAGCSHWGAYNGPCARSQGARPTFFLNADGPAFRNGRLTVQGYQTVVHELFHAIQANTVMGRSPKPCKWNNWILEGMADAVSMDVLEYLWPGFAQPRDDGWIMKKFGVRPYHETFALDPSGYPVSSFWRFLADLNKGYDYLFTGRDGAAGVFDFEIPDGGNWKSEVMWLDQALYTKFNMRLNEMLGLFLNDYSMRIPPLSWRSGNIENDLPRWVKGVLGDCEEIFLSDRQPSRKFSRNIAAVAGDCAWLTVNVSQATAQVSLQVETDDVSVFKDIWVGLAEGNTVLSDAIAAGSPPNNPDKYIGTWRSFTVRSSVPVLLTFANAADDPENSRRRHVIFDISVPTFATNLRGNAPAGPGKAAPPALKPSNRKHTQSLPQKQAATSAMIAEQKRLDKEALSPNHGSSTNVGFHRNVHACREPFKYLPCGPTTAISLQLVPGSYLSLDQTSGTGGAASQLFSSFVGQALSNPFDANEVMEDLEKKLESIDAASVSISMPLIDYDFSGSITNAHISTTVGGTYMESIDRPDDSNRTRLIGEVNIEVFSPFLIRGSFNAPLAYFEEAPDGRMVYRRGPTLSGTFNHVAPWLSDNRVAAVELQSMREVADDVGKAFGVPAATMRSLREQGVIPDGDTVPGSASGGGGGAATVKDSSCDCDCASKGKVDELCEFYCEEQFAACP